MYSSICMNVESPHLLKRGPVSMLLAFPMLFHYHLRRTVAACRRIRPFSEIRQAEETFSQMQRWRYSYPHNCTDFASLNGSGIDVVRQNPTLGSCSNGECIDTRHYLDYSTRTEKSSVDSGILCDRTCPLLQQADKTPGLEILVSPNCTLGVWCSVSTTEMQDQQTSGSTPGHLHSHS